jgi:hypothetical protein
MPAPPPPSVPTPPLAPPKPPLPALPPERPSPPAARERDGGGYPGLVVLVFVILAALLVGAIVLIAVLVANGAWPLPTADALVPAVAPFL